MKFYDPYYGHPLKILNFLKQEFEEKQFNFIYFLGDSTLDNKHWVRNKPQKSLPLFEKNLEYMLPDISFFMNKKLYENNEKYICLNFAVEENHLKNRNNSTNNNLIPLNGWEDYVSSNLTENDILIVSIGGNDLALKLNIPIILNLCLSLFLSDDLLRKNPYLIYYILDIYKNYLKQFLLDIIKYKKPKMIVLCGVYFPCIDYQDSWCKNILNIMKYNVPSYRKNIHCVLEMLFEEGLKSLNSENIPELEGIEIKYIPLYKVLNCEDKEDYVAGVEPSVQGGEKMAEAFYNSIFE